MQNSRLAISYDTPKEKDEIVEAISVFVMENLKRGLAIKSQICSLSGFPNVTEEDEDREKQAILLSSEIIALFLLGEISEEEYYDKITDVIYAEVTRYDPPADADDERSARIYCRKTLPIFEWEALPGGSKDLAAKYLNSAIRLAQEKGMTLREFFSSPGHYEEIVISLYENAEEFARELTGWITKFFTLETAASIFIDAMVEAGDISEISAAVQRKKAEENEEIKKGSKKVALSGAIIAVESATDIFGKSPAQKEKLNILKEELEKFKETTVLA